MNNVQIVWTLKICSFFIERKCNQSMELFKTDNWLGKQQFEISLHKHNQSFEFWIRFSFSLCSIIGISLSLNHSIFSFWKKLHFIQLTKRLFACFDNIESIDFPVCLNSKQNPGKWIMFLILVTQYSIHRILFHQCLYCFNLSRIV